MGSPEKICGDCQNYRPRLGEGVESLAKEGLCRALNGLLLRTRTPDLVCSKPEFFVAKVEETLTS